MQNPQDRNKMLTTQDLNLLETMFAQAKESNDADLLETILKNPHLTSALKKKAEDTFVDCLTRRAEEAEALGSDEMRKAELKTDAQDTVSDSTVQRMSRLNCGEKIKLALFGTREERFLLIRDTNRVIATSVIKGPKITDNEVETIAQMRNINKEILEIIGRNRQWLKNYTVVLNLAKNPKTPISISLKLLNLLQKKDIALLAKDRSVSDIVRTTAARIFSTRSGN